MKDRFITITGFKYYYGTRPLQIGALVKCIKEPDNSYDQEAIKAVMPMIGTVGYVANSPSTVAGGTMSAGRIYDHVKRQFYVRVMFTTFTKVICKIEFGSNEAYERELRAQMGEDEDDWGWIEDEEVPAGKSNGVFYYQTSDEDDV